MKVAAHQAIIADLTPVETLGLQLAETRQIYQAVVDVHIRVGKKAASTSNQPEAGVGSLLREGARGLARSSQYGAVASRADAGSKADPQVLPG